MSDRVFFTTSGLRLSKIAKFYLARLQSGNGLCNEHFNPNPTAINQLVRQDLCTLYEYEIVFRGNRKKCFRLELTGKGKQLDLLTFINLGEKEDKKPKQPDTGSRQSRRMVKKYIIDHADDPTPLIYRKSDCIGYHVWNHERNSYIPHEMGERIIEEYGLIPLPMELMDTDYAGNTMYIRSKHIHLFKK